MATHVLRGLSPHHTCTHQPSTHPHTQRQQYRYGVYAVIRQIRLPLYKDTVRFRIALLRGSRFVLDRIHAKKAPSIGEQGHAA